MNRIKDLKQYTCIKNVKAAPCDLYTAQEAIGRKLYKDDCENMMGYLVEYEDGYISWSPKSVFNKGYVLTETHIDRMKFELAELNERIGKATRALYTLDLMNSFDRKLLSEQLEHMRGYANILYDRIAFFCSKLMSKDESLKIISDDVAKEGTL